MKQTLFTGFSPSTRPKDMRIALSFLLFPWKWSSWKKGSFRKDITASIEGYFGEQTNALVYDSGRSALYEALKAMGIGKGDEVLVQAYTCMVVVNAIKWTGATPVYIDIEKETLNMDPEKARQKCSSQTKAIIIQHTFGLPANIDALMDVAKAFHLKTIEDCAHSLGARYKGKLTGTFADVGMLSFGGEKVISCVRGGALITKDRDLFHSLEKSQQALPESPRRVVRQHLLHVVLFPIGKRFYHLFFGKLLLKLVKVLHITNKIIYPEEKVGKRVPWYPSKLPNALAALLVSQFPEIETFNTHRKHIAVLYKKALEGKTSIEYQVDDASHIYLRYPLFMENPRAVRARAKHKGVLLGDWYSLVIGPGDVDLNEAGYVEHMCPVAEERTSKAINLPTNIHIQDADVPRIIATLFE
ncbi:MAG: hypothetical protein COU32_01380 [Candidatus Magasanikbacteria bacterium CG10_big_fil_rev_8_21_14_0_10_42_10]|uniref:Aminotransferase n=2 Tax=Candidatus Magasanikiibacteriota TaxID=1752731 RepID=A0A2H0TYI7_9BACT|nr:MAG: hypothetical protein COU32_01380 [Candidatus Magasanikbacteria bacterium CG10_big_fil_rev_8_21_14_0_10_42_10]PIZ94667.1 MAG: hypothetical protein COX82_00200 [Candidatus Magasanikbacteria bacterium CG_4_10_14_0_2_um_filter_41_10]